MNLVESFLLLFVLSLIQKASCQYNSGDNSYQLEHRKNSNYNLNEQAVEQLVANEYQPDRPKNKLDDQAVEQLVANEYQPDRPKSKFDQDLDKLLKLTNSLDNEESNSFIPTRSKKWKYVPEPLTCSEKFKQESNVIVDSKASVKNGAELLLPIRYIAPGTAKKGLNALQDSCMKECCDEADCDTALLSMTLGTDGYRCYLFKCNGRCLYINHKDYVVLRMRTPEQLNDHGILQTTSVQQTTRTTEQPKPNKPENNYNAEMMGGSSFSNVENFEETSLKLDLAQKAKIYFMDKTNAITSTGNMALAIIILILGIGIVVSLFGYLILSTKFVNKKLNKLRNKSKNVDVDGDYLINGMYL